MGNSCSNAESEGSKKGTVPSARVPPHEQKGSLTWAQQVGKDEEDTIVAPQPQAQEEEALSPLEFSVRAILWSDDKPLTHYKNGAALCPSVVPLTQ